RAKRSGRSSATCASPCRDAVPGASPKTTSEPGVIGAAELDRLRAATGRAALDPAVGLFPPESVLRRVNREAILLLGGGRALLLQVAHPLVAAGVAGHSRFRSEPLARPWRTPDPMPTILLGG